MTIIRIGLDTSKHVFQVHGVDESEAPVLRRQLRRGEMRRFFTKLTPTRIGLEACGAAHYWARVLREPGHAVVLIPPQYVKPYVKRGKNDAIDAEAICEAMSRPGMRFVPVKSAENQAALMLVRVRDLMVKQRTMVINAMRGHAAEFGVIAAKGPVKVAELMRRVQDPAAGVPALARTLLGELADQLASINAKLKTIDARLMVWHRHDQRSRLLASIPGVGPIGAVSFALKSLPLARTGVPDPKVFRSARHFAAWVGLTPKENATGGRRRPGGISRQGDRSLRRLLVLGATTVIRFANPRVEPAGQEPTGKASPWLVSLLARKPKKLAAVALANKMARMIWAMLGSGEFYRPPQAA
jgi:transposase